MIFFSSLDDLVTYKYAFYDSMILDTNLQVDFLPINVKKSQINRAIKTKWQVIWKLTSMIKDCDRLTKHKVNQEAYLMIYQSIEKSKKAYRAKRKEFQDRKEYFKIYRSKCRLNSAFKAKETVYQKESKQSARKDPVFKTKERESKQFARRNPLFKTKATVYQKESKQSARKDPVF